MEEGSLGSRRSQRSRPDSSSSCHTKMTPASSSNGSSANLPVRVNGGRTTPSSGASLLQERLRDRKVESARQSRHGSVDIINSRDREIQSSPIAREEKKPGSMAGKTLGIKGMGEQVSTLHKQNFDLKLELYHRRERQETLELRLLTAEKQIAEKSEVEEINDQLLAELEKRDQELRIREQAVEEAVSIITSLENKVDRLMKEREGVRSVESDYESTYFRPGQDGSFRSSPPSFDDRKGNDSGRSVPRMPSFLSETSENTEALRSLYLPIDRAVSEATLPQLVEESTQDGMNSPRLSVLSESSFISIYGERPPPSLSLDSTNEAESPSPPRREQASQSVEKWMDDRPVSVAPSLSRPVRRNLSKTNNQYLSINTILDSPLQRLEKLKHTLEKHQTSSPLSKSQPTVKPAAVKGRKTMNEIARRTVTVGECFDGQERLPPTPDTFSTDTLRRFQKSNADPFAVNDRTRDNTFLDSTSTFPSRQVSHVSMRPRSAGETITSKRDGHGWDTDTQGDYTEAGSVSELDGMYNIPSIHRPQRVMTPDLFTFSGRNHDWGDEMKYSTAAHVPVASNLTAERHRAVRRRSSMLDSQATSTSHSSTLPDGDAIYPPDRTSSLAAPTKLRKAHASITPVEATTPVSLSPAKNSKMSRLSGRIFGRESKTTASMPPPASPLKTIAVRSPTYFQGLEEEARATPPPIRRSRTGPGLSQRPSSSGVDRTIRRVNEFGGYDGAADEPSYGEESLAVGEVEHAKNMSASLGSKKWFGIARAGSLRRTN